MRSGWSARMMRVVGHWEASDWQAIEAIMAGVKVGEIPHGTGQWFDIASQFFTAYEAHDWSTCWSLVETAKAEWELIVDRNSRKGKGGRNK